MFYIKNISHNSRIVHIVDRNRYGIKRPFAIIKQKKGGGNLKRQVIFLMTDTTRKDMVGCYGNPDMKTPNLDKMANEGIRYENAYTCQPVCGPARSAIFTGTFPHTNGMVTNSVALDGNARTIGQRLTESGIECGYIGKWHLDGGDYFGNGQCPEGWNPNYWYDMRCYLEELTEEERVRSRNVEEAYKNGVTEEFTYAHRCTDRALKFLEEFQQDDFFLTVSYDEPHDPSLCPAPYDEMYKNFQFKDTPAFHDDLDKKNLMQRLWAEEFENMAGDERMDWSLFLGCNSYVDYEIGRILEVIEKKMPNALVIFTSDHGALCGEHHLFSKNAAIYKEVANIPLIIKGGARGKVVDTPASHIDIAPTIMDFFKLQIPRVLEGKSMLPQIQDPTIKINEAVFTEFTRYEVDHDGFGGLQIMRAVISERYKLAVNLLDRDEFYDLQKDPYEINNLIDDEAYLEIIRKYHKLLIDHMNDTRDLYRGYQWSMRPWNKGYVPKWRNEGFTRQRENEVYEPRQLDYDTGLPMESSIRKKR